MKTYLFVVTILLLTCSSCNSGQNKNTTIPRPGKSEMENLNKYLVQRDRERIENYIVRKNISMTESKTGFWFLVRSEGDGDYLKDNDRVIMEYECSLLDGTICYSSKDLGPKAIIVGRNDMGSGINEGLKMLKRGGKALFIIPPFLAYGFVGDGNKIPSKAILVYEITVLK